MFYRYLYYLKYTYVGTYIFNIYKISTLFFFVLLDSRKTIYIPPTHVKFFTMKSKYIHFLQEWLDRESYPHPLVISRV